jgi:prolyl-tRNA synthetase
MTHSDDKGLVLPPRIAPIKVIIVPIFNAENKDKILKCVNEITKKFNLHEIMIDDRDDYTPGWKYNEWELKGVPVRIEIGPKDIEKEQVILVRRDTGEKKPVNFHSIESELMRVLEDIQSSLYEKANKFLKESILTAEDWHEFKEVIEKRKIVKGFFCGDLECETEIKTKTEGVTSRCIPFEQPKKIGKCVHCGMQGKFIVYFSRSY